MTAWNDLLAAGLLGTDKAPVPLDALPEALRTRLTAAPPTDREGALLRAAALLLPYLRAGTLPPQPSLPLPAPCPEETRPVAPPEFQNVLNTLLDDASPSLPLLQRALAVCAARGWVLPPDDLPRLLDQAGKPGFRPLQEILPEIVGRRGEWLAQFRPAWRFALPLGDPETTWREGRLEARRALFRRLRRENPAQALALLESTWPEASAKERKTWLDALRPDARADDLPFFRNIFEEIPENQNPGKTEWRPVLHQLLLSIPESGRGQELFEAHLRHYFTVPKKKTLGLFGKKTEIGLKTPDQPAQALTPERVYGEWGFPSKSGDGRFHFALSETAYWLRVLLPFVPPSAWCGHWGLDAAGCVRGFCENPEFRFENAAGTFRFFLEPLAEATRRYGDAAFAQALFQHAPPNEPALLPLAPLVSSAEVEAYFTRCEPQFAAEHLHELTAHLPRWSARLSALLLRQLAQALAAAPYHSFRFDVWLPNWHPTTPDTVEAATPKNIQDYQLGTLHQRLFGPVRWSVELQEKLMAFEKM